MLLEAQTDAYPTICSRTKQLLERLLSQGQGKAGVTQQQLLADFGRPLAGALLPSVTKGSCCSEASDLLAALVDAFGADFASAGAASQPIGPRYARGEPSST